VDFFAVRDSLPKNAIVLYPGMIDRLFDHCFGALEWRSLRFEWETVGVRDFQGTSVMNYGDPDVPFTRIHEFKHYHPEWREAYECGQSVICREYPQTWAQGLEAYYPVNDDRNQRLFER
jgi:UDP-galactopyranose mutase